MLGRVRSIGSRALLRLPSETSPRGVARGRDGAYRLSGQAAARRERVGDLVFVMSMPRSGTNAFGSLVKEGFPEVAWEGECFLGQLRQSTRERLKDRFPWATEIDFARRRTLDPAQRQRELKRFRARMSENAESFLDSLLDDREYPTVIKVFPTHLERGALACILAEFRPRIIDLRRQMIFSFISISKARASGAWTRMDSTENAAEFSNTAVRDFAMRADEWTDWYVGQARALGLPYVRVSYTGLFETRGDHSAIRTFFADTPHSPVTEQPDAWVPRTMVQDRRTDGSLLDSFAGFATLSRRNRMLLLREPGSMP